MRPEFVPLLALYALTAGAPFVAAIGIWLLLRSTRGYGHAICFGGLLGALAVTVLIWIVGIVTSSPLHGTLATWLAFASAGFSLFALLAVAGHAVRRRMRSPRHSTL